MSVMKEIIDWAETLEDWKQDIVRRILLKGHYTKDDLREIINNVLFANQYIEKLEIGPIKIKRESIKTIENLQSNKVVLHKIDSPRNINALASDSLLKFALDGLTIIYGENGTGKSGYSRVLKKCCKARDIDALLPNIYLEGDVVPARVNVAYSHNGDNKSLDWIDGQASISELDQIIVYDNKCGKIQVTEKNELIYLPNGTDLFKKVIDCLIEVREEIAKNKPSVVTINFEKVDTASTVFVKLKSINAKTSTEYIKTEFGWKASDDAKQIELSKKLIEANEEEVRKKLVKIDKEIIKLQEVRSDLSSFEQITDVEKYKNIVEIIKNKNDSKNALAELSNEMTEDRMLAGTGNELWRVMYDAAKEFSIKNVYENIPFPNADGACVLCQQSLDVKAKERMQVFSKFSEGKIKKNFDEAEKLIKESIKFLEGREDKYVSTLKNLELEYSCLNEAEVNTIIAHLDYLKKLNAILLSTIKEEVGEDESKQFSSLSLLEFIDKVILKTKNKKTEIEKSINPEMIKILKKEKMELDSLKIVSNRVEDIVRYVKYLNENEKYNNMLKSLEYTSISKKGTAIITNSLKDSFLQSLSLELTRLGGERIPLLVNSTTKEGIPTFQLSLKNANMPTKVKLDNILSEGEQKIASLAGLFAELETAKHENGIILDDPVTSLDHQFRKKIAERLVQEAQKRQVIIFTHDIAFLFDLEFHAKELGVPTLLQNIRRDGEKAGVIFNINPWHAQNTKERLVTIETDILNLERLNLEGEIYNSNAGNIYGRLRETWERIVEEILFNEVITRFGQTISTQRLQGVYVDDSDYSLIYFEMAKCSKYMIGHDKSLAVTDDRPNIKNIREDVKVSREFINMVNKRKTDLSKQRKDKVEKLPVAQVVD